MSEDDIIAAIDKGEFIEHAKVHGNYYGTSKKSLEAVQKANKTCILDIDLQGMQSIHNAKLDPSPFFVFILPPSMAILEARLLDR